MSEQGLDLIRQLAVRERVMSVFQKHYDICRQDRNYLYMTLGLAFWGALIVATLVFSMISALLS